MQPAITFTDNKGHGRRDRCAAGAAGVLPVKGWKIRGFGENCCFYPGEPV
ncbi:hypothetical protein HMPREF1545_03450 [Oscillibacter sp. KLE 1728]|nr:hypothetical protein HMPREF1545_03450 [Oscillibacter sp. KLE 1728]